MSGKKNAVIILYTGDDLPDYVVEQIAKILLSSGITVPELLTVIHKDQEAISEALLRDATAIPLVQEATKDDLAEAIKAAIVYIGKRFEASLTNTKGNMVPFAMELSTALEEDSVNSAFNVLNPKTELRKAVELLSETEYVIPAHLARKYHFTENVVNTIKFVYKKTI